MREYKISDEFGEEWYIRRRIYDLLEAFDTLRRERSISADLDTMLGIVIEEVINVSWAGITMSHSKF